MSTPQTIFIVEDDLLYIELYNEILGNDFNTVCFTEAREALSQYQTYQPKTIILDLNMPDINGIEFCRALFEQYSCAQNVDIIFVSGESDNHIKLSAFEAGAADFICKPFELKELLFKVRSSVKRKLKQESLVGEVSQSQQLVYTTMAQASQYSQVMNFFKNLNACTDLAEVSQAFFDTMSNFNLNCSIRFKSPEIVFFNANGTEVSPIEKEVYDLLESQGRIYPFSNRLMINDQHVSFIIKNPPSDEDELGQIRDYVAVMIEGLEAKVLDLYSKQGLASAIVQLSSNIEGLKLGMNEHNALVNSVMSNMMAEIATSFHSLEMTDAQESFFNQLIEKGSEQLMNAEGKLVNIMAELEHLKQTMENVQSETKIEKPVQGFELTDDIELF